MHQPPQPQYCTIWAEESRGSTSEYKSEGRGFDSLQGLEIHFSVPWCGWKSVLNMFNCSYFPIENRLCVQFFFKMCAMMSSIRINNNLGDFNWNFFYLPKTVQPRICNFGFRRVLVSITNQSQKNLTVGCRVDSWEYVGFFKNFVRPRYRRLRTAQHEIKRACTNHHNTVPYVQLLVFPDRKQIMCPIFFQNVCHDVIYPNE